MFEERAEKYNSLQWVKDRDYLDAVVNACGIKSKHTVCDVGTGTGAVANAVSQYACFVDAIDISEEMLNIAKTKCAKENIRYRVADILGEFGGVYDCVVARMVLHHVEKDKDAVANCIRHTKIGGTLVIAEGIPQEGTEEFFADVFRLKEKRNVYTISKLRRMIDLDVDVRMYRQDNMSTRNWLSNSGLSESVQQEIFNMHLDAPKYVKRAYNMRAYGGDIIMDWRTAIVTGIVE